MKQNFYTSYRTIRRIFILLMLTLSLLPMQSRGKTIVYDDTNSSNYIQLDLQEYYDDWQYMVFYIEDNEGNKVKINDLTIISAGSQTLSYNQSYTDFDWKNYSILEYCIRYNGGKAEAWKSMYLNMTIAPKTGIDINKCKRVKM